MKTNNILNTIYDSSISGKGVFGESIQKLADEYVQRYGRTEKAIDKLVSNQRLKSTATGFVTGLGGVVTLPVAIPVDLASSLYIEIRMIAAIAAIRGFDVESDEVRTLIYLCLVGNSAGDILKQAGIKYMADLTAKKLMPLLSKKIAEKVAENVASKFLVKTAAKGLPKLAKMLPVVGGIAGGAYNYVEVSTFAKVARKRFN